MTKFRVGQHKMKNKFSATVHEVTLSGQLLGILTYHKSRVPAVWDSYGKFANAIGVDLGGVDASEFDLAPIEHNLWLNIYIADTGYMFEPFPTRSEADAAAYSSRIACIEQQFYEGEGV